MPEPEDLRRLLWLVVLVLLLALVALGIILALMAAWRNIARREKLLEQGRRLRARERAARGERPPADDAWRLAGQRVQLDDEDDDEEDHRPSEDYEPPDDEDEDEDDDELPRRR